MNSSIRSIALGTSIFALVTPLSVQAATINPENAGVSQSVSPKSNINVKFAPSAEASRFVKQLTDSGLAKELKKDSNGNIVLLLSDTELQTRFHYSEADIRTLKSIIEIANNNKEPIAGANAAATAFVNGSNKQSVGQLGAVHPNLSFSSWTVHFSNSDIRMYLWAAIAAGPEAVVLAITALATLADGPTGAGLSLVWGVMGGASIAIFMYCSTIAIANDKGVYIAINWDGNWPKLVIDTE